MNIDTQSFIRVSQIIERDSKDASYKFALLRATIDVISLFDQHIIISKDRVIIPTGLIIERWLWYYYPLIDSEIFLPQKNGEPKTITKGRNIYFRKFFISLIDEYSKYGRFEHFYNDFKKKSLSKDVNSALLNLVKGLHKTITEMPMKFIGNSVSKGYYSIYKLESKRKKIYEGNKLTTELLISQFGSFSIPSDYYLVLKHLGSFIGGDSSLINKWADFVVTANKSHPVEKNYILEKLSIKPESFRDVTEVKSFYKKKQNLHCVWSGKKISNNNLNIDHVLPFAHYLNNDIWNLLPTLNIVNSMKSDKIPTPDLIDKRKDIIIDYWSELHDFFDKGFEEELRISLVPNLDFSNNENWNNKTLEALKTKSEFLIDIRGLEPWTI